MRHLPFSSDTTFDIALLVKPAIFNEYSLRKNYVDHFSKPTMGFTLEYDNGAKVTAKTAKAYLAELLPIIAQQGINLLFVTDGVYFKQLTKATKVDATLGYVMPCTFKGYEHLKVVYGINYQSIVYNPNIQQKLDLAISAVTGYFGGSFQEPGQDIIHSAAYPVDDEVEAHLKQLHQYPEIAGDIEAFSLKHYKAGIGTIAFAPDQHNGICFPCDYKPHSLGRDLAGNYGRYVRNPRIRKLLKEFLSTYQGIIKWHGSTYDLKVIIYVLWMEEDPLNIKGMLEGLHCVTQKFHDTKLIAYLALNSTARNSYSLKDLAHEFAGNWAQEEINDIRKISLPELLKYNLIDTLSTNYVFDKYYPKMVQDSQEDLYLEIFKPSVKSILQIELVGMPLNMGEVLKAEKSLLTLQQDAHQQMRLSSIFDHINSLLRHKAMEAKNAKLKKKRHPIEAFAHIEFNPNSNQQVQMLLYDVWELPVIDYTKTKAPATGAKTLKKLINHTDNPEIKDFLKALTDYSKVNKILTSFIPAFKDAVYKVDGKHYLHGNFVLGGTVSGRLSSNSPNLQNLPSGSQYGKLIKKCVQPPDGWLFCGADFNSLEDYISALTTKDPNKLKIYAGVMQFNLNINGEIHTISEDTIVRYDGIEMNGVELYEKLTNSKPRVISYK